MRKITESNLWLILLVVVFVVIPIIRIRTTPPTAQMSYYPSKPLTDEVINFDASVSHAEGSIKITSYEWDFGDGKTELGIRVNHTYPQAGTYEVELTVTNELGKTGTDQKTVIIVSPVAKINVEVKTSTYKKVSTRGTRMVEEDIRDSLRKAGFFVA